MSTDLQSQLRRRLGIGADPGAGTKALPNSTLLLPEGPGPHPAVLYCHAHGGQYDLGRSELFQGARWLCGPYGPALVGAGFAVLCVDMPGFGARRSDGRESALAKAGLWQGRPLFGQMVAAQLQALAWLREQDGIDPDRIITLGVSMGGALALWTAALAPKVAACVQLNIFANLAPLIAAGGHDRHGIYLTVPGLLELTDIGEIAGLIAPRPQFIGLGALDPFTPPDARRAALAQVQGAYRRENNALTVHLEATGEHGETPAMRQAVFEFLGHAAQPTKRETTSHA